MIDSVINELGNGDWPIPCFGVGFGIAEPTGAGAYDVEAILAYLASENKAFRGFGKVLVTESAYRKIAEEDEGVAAHFHEVDKIRVPRPGAEEVRVYNYDYGVAEV